MVVGNGLRRRRDRHIRFACSRVYRKIENHNITQTVGELGFYKTDNIHFE